MNKQRFSVYTDGIMYICRESEQKSDFGAVKNAKRESEIIRTGKLAFREMSKRDEDLEFAESHGRTLTIKVATRLYPDISKLDQIIIGSVLYSILKIDISREKRENYIYLEEVRSLS